MSSKPVSQGESIFTVQDAYLENNLNVLANYKKGDPLSCHPKQKRIEVYAPYSWNLLSSWLFDPTVFEYTFKRAYQIKHFTPMTDLSSTEKERIKVIQNNYDAAFKNLKLINAELELEDKKDKKPIVDVFKSIFEACPYIPPAPVFIKKTSGQSSPVIPKVLEKGEVTENENGDKIRNVHESTRIQVVPVPASSVRNLRKTPGVVLDLEKQEKPGEQTSRKLERSTSLYNPKPSSANSTTSSAQAAPKKNSKPLSEKALSIRNKIKKWVSSTPKEKVEMQASLTEALAKIDPKKIQGKIQQLEMPREYKTNPNMWNKFLLQKKMAEAEVTPASADCNQNDWTDPVVIQSSQSAPTARTMTPTLLQRPLLNRSVSVNVSSSSEQKTPIQLTDKDKEERKEFLRLVMEKRRNSIYAKTSNSEAPASVS